MFRKVKSRSLLNSSYEEGLKYRSYCHKTLKSRILCIFWRVRAKLSFILVPESQSTNSIKKGRGAYINNLIIYDCLIIRRLVAVLVSLKNSAKILHCKLWVIDLTRKKKSYRHRAMQYCSSDPNLIRYRGKNTFWKSFKAFIFIVSVQLRRERSNLQKVYSQKRIGLIQKWKETFRLFINHNLIWRKNARYL